MIRRVDVVPDGQGWMICSDALAQQPWFHSGARAEAEAYRLAMDMAADGVPTEICIYLRGGALGGRRRVPGRQTA